MQGTQRSERLEARIPKDLKILLTRAAALRSQTLTDFVVSAATDAALRAVEQAELLAWTARDQAQFARDLLDPPAANEALRTAAQRFRLRAEP